MQTLLPYPDFAKSAACLDRKRLGNQRNEAFIVLRTNRQGPLCLFRLKTDDQKGGFVYGPIPADVPEGHVIRRTPWYAHATARMWRGYDVALRLYGRTICEEWISRGYRDSMRDRFCDGPVFHQHPPWLGDPAFHLAHQSNLIRKDPAHYRPIFGNDVPDDLPYIWPV